MSPQALLAAVDAPIRAVARRIPPRPQSIVQTPELVTTAQSVLAQGLDLLIRLRERAYSQVLTPYNSSIGQHYGRAVERFQCLARGVRSREINYSARSRSARIENELSYASIATCEVLRALKQWTPETLSGKCSLIAPAAYESSRPSKVDSNFARELVDCTEHALYEFSVISLLCQELGVAVSPDFGDHPSR